MKISPALEVGVFVGFLITYNYLQRLMKIDDSLVLWIKTVIVIPSAKTNN